MPKSTKHLYEGMYILSATLSEDARSKAIEKITGSIEHHGGEIHKIFEQGRKKLAYEINRRREGFFYVIYFSVDPSSSPEMWRDYKLNEDLIRFMTLRVENVPEKIEFKQLVTSE